MKRAWGGRETENDFLKTENLCEFLAFYGVITQSVIQSLKMIYVVWVGKTEIL